MEVLASLGINTAVIVAIVGVSEAIKMVDKKVILKRFYVLLPLVLAFISGLLMTSPFNWQGVGYNTFLYFGISSLSYVVVKRTILGQDSGNVITNIINGNGKTGVDVKKEG